MSAVIFGRKSGTNRSGGSFTYEQKLAVWNKAATVLGRTPLLWRRDPCGALIYWDAYGDTTPTGNGWEVDHIFPVSRRGSDDLSNLQALQWENNRAKGDSTSGWTCAVVRRR
jgi:hypothetical protein